MSDGLLYHLDYQDSRYFLNVVQTFSDGTDSNVQLDADLKFELKENDIVVATLTKNAGVVEYEYSSGNFRYIISDYEVTHLDVEDLSGTWTATSSTTATTPTDIVVIADEQLGGDTMSVASSTIADNATGVSVRPTIGITFDTAINQNTAVLQGFSFIDVTGKVGVSRKLRITSATSLEIEPTLGLRANTKYRLVIHGGTTDYAIQGTGGEKLAENYILDFTTGTDTFTEISEVTDPRNLERRAPVRISSAYNLPTSAQTAPVLFTNGTTSWTKVQQPITDTVTITFSEALSDPLDLSQISIEVTPVLGDDSFYSEAPDTLFYPLEPETVPAVATIEINDVSTSQLDITFDADLYYNTVILVTFTNLEFDSGSTFTGTYKHLVKMTPLCGTIPILRMDLGGFLVPTLTDADILMHLHAASVDRRLRYGAPTTCCKHIFHKVCRLSAALKLMDNWLATRAALGSSKSLGDFSVSSIPRPEIIMGSTTNPGPYTIRYNELQAEERSLRLCGVGTTHSDFFSGNYKYPSSQLRLRTRLLDFHYDTLGSFGNDAPL